MSAHLQRALVLIDLRRPAQAEEELRHALAEQPNNSYAHRSLAWCLAIQGRLPEARLEAEEAIRLKPDNSGTHRILGWIYLLQGRWNEAEKALREAIRLNSEDAEFFLCWLKTSHKESVAANPRKLHAKVFASIRAV